MFRRYLAFLGVLVYLGGEKDWMLFLICSLVLLMIYNGLARNSLL